MRSRQLATTASAVSSLASFIRTIFMADKRYGSTFGMTMTFRRGDEGAI
jgi:hypothetical protein